MDGICLKNVNIMLNVIFNQLKDVRIGINILCYLNKFVMLFEFVTYVIM